MLCTLLLRVPMSSIGSQRGSDTYSDMKPRDLLPNLPHEGPPVPRFLTQGLFQKHEEEHEEEVPFTDISTNVSTDETITYQNHELAKTLLVLEAHLAQGCRIAGKPCDCCSGRHPLELEKLSEEALSMVDKQVYRDIIEFAREVDQKANVAALRTRQYDSDYPLLAVRARNMRKQLTAYNDARDKASTALRMIKSGEIS